MSDTTISVESVVPSNSMVPAKSCLFSRQWPSWVKVGASALVLTTIVGSGYKLYSAYQKCKIHSSSPSNPPPEVVVPLLAVAKQIQEELNADASLPDEGL